MYTINLYHNKDENVHKYEVRGEKNKERGNKFCRN